MKIIPIEQLYQTEYSVSGINSMLQYWRTQSSFSCIGTPKERNILLFLDGCSAEYTLKDGSCLLAESGDIIYTPVGSEYQVRFLEFASPDSHTIGINFLLSDEESEPFLFSNTITIFRNQQVACKDAFVSAQRYGESAVPCPAMLKSAVYEILTHLSFSSRRESLLRQNYHMISAGILYLENDVAQTKSIAEIARMCNGSEVYFRRMFKQYAGVSPMEYRMEGKILRAKTYLTFGDMTVTEISDTLGFTDPSYFAKQFKLRTGFSPSEYRGRTQSL